MAFRRLSQLAKRRAPRSTPSRRSRLSRAAFNSAPLAYGIEPLEARTMLTTFFGGDTFEYIDDRNQLNRVVFDGNITAEVIGSLVDPTNNSVSLVNLSGVRTNANGSVDIGGGLNPQDAVQLIGPLGTVTDPANGNAVIPNFNLTALGANASGQTFGVGTRPGTGNTTIVDIVRFTIPTAGTVNGTVVAEFNSLNVSVIGGADFDPGSGDLFFTGNRGANTPDLLFTVDTSLNTRSAIEGSINTVGTFIEPNNTPVAITGITFTAAGAFSGLATVEQDNGGGGGGAGNFNAGDTTIFNATLNNLAVVLVPLTITVPGQGGGGGGQQGGVQGLISIEAAPNGRLILTGSGQGAFVYSTDQQGNAIQLGTLPEGTLGEQIVALTFVQGLTDPFTGGTGAFVGFDGTQQQFVFLDTRNRVPSQNIWAIYISQSDANASIAIGWVREADDDNATPDIKATTGNTGPVRVFPAQGGQLITVDSGAETGQVYIGARTLDIGPDPFDDLRPVVTAQVIPNAINFGVLPATTAQLRPGIYMAAGNEINRILIGGTLTGVVDIRGSVDLFYAGWLLTGDARGLPEGSAASSPQANNSFRVDGDLRSLFVLDSIGTNGDFPGDDPVYVTGFDMQVNGRLGEVHSLDTIVGNAEVAHLQSAPQMTVNQREYEDHRTTVNAATGLFDILSLGGPGDNPVATDYPAAPGNQNAFYNDTFWTAQRLGSTFNSGRDNVIRVDGVLQNSQAFQTDGVANPDPADYYAVPLMAGQTISVELSAQPGFLAAGVFDPDGRLIATDYNNVNTPLTENRVFRFTADRPGMYRFAVGVLDDTGTGNDGDPPFARGSLILGQSVPYTLSITNAGDIALGSIVANNTVYDLPGKPGFRVLRGDFGAVETVAPALAPVSRFVATGPATLGRIISTNSSFGMIVSEGGNLRAIDGGIVGQIFGVAGALTFGQEIEIDVPNGSVGQIRSRAGATTGGEYGGIAVANLFSGSVATGFKPIGGSYQLIDAPRGFAQVFLAAKGGMGVLRARSMATPNGASVITLNADNQNRDGILDLIDVAEDLGTLGTGGPQITTNTGGNVRYMRVLGNVYPDEFFGVGGPSETVVDPGEEITITDDSGANLRIKALGDTFTNPAFDPLNPNGVPQFLGTTLLLTTYGIRGSGGSAIIDISATTFITAIAGGPFLPISIGAAGTNASGYQGLSISSSGGASAEIGRIEAAGVGTQVVVNTTSTSTQQDFTTQIVTDSGGGRSIQLVPRTVTRTTFATQLGTTGFGGAPAQPLEVRLSGSATIDVLNVVITATDLADLGNATVISNDTPDGEIANVTAESVGVLSSRGTIGLTKSHNFTAVEGIEDLAMGNVLVPGASSAASGTTINNGTGTGRLLRQVYTDRTVPFGSPTPTEKQFVSNVRNGVVLVGGNLMEVNAGKGMGNIYVQGSIGSINPNSDGANDPTVLDGVRAPIVTFSFSSLEKPNEDGRILNVNIGEGVAWGGSGDFSRAGIFAYGNIGPITGNNGADIRGQIHARRFFADLGGSVLDETGTGLNAIGPIDPSAEVGIQSIRLNNGSLIDATVGVSDERSDVIETDLGRFSAREFPDAAKRPFFDLGPISLSGNGGIIGSAFFAADIGKVSVDNGGFGVINSDFTVVGDGQFLGIDAGGYGIRGVSILGGASVSNIIAEGDGSSKSTASVTPSVRFSEGAIPTDASFGPIDGEEPVDPYTGRVISSLTDIHRYLGTSAGTPELAGHTDTGIIEGVDARGSRELGYSRAWQIRADEVNGFGNTMYNFANAIGTIVVSNIIDGFNITTGRFKNFNPRADVFNLDLNVAGSLKKFSVAGNLRGNSVIRTSGNNGNIGSLSIGGDLEGSVQSTRIKSLTVGGNFSGQVTASSNSSSAIGTVVVKGALVGNALTVNGGIKKLVAGQFGTAIGDKLTVNGPVGAIQVIGDMRASLQVNGNLKSLRVGGSILSGGLNPGLTITVTGVFDTLQVGGNVEQGVTITPQPKKLTVNGQFAGTVV